MSSLTLGAIAFILDFQMRTASEKEKPGLELGFCYFLLFAIYGITSPYMPVILRSIGYSPSGVGVLLAAFELVGIGGPIYLARVADSSGRSKPYLLASGLSVLAGLAVLVSLHQPLFTLLSLSMISLGLKTPIPIFDASILRSIEVNTSKGKGKRIPKYGTSRALGSVGFILVTIGVQCYPGFDQSPPWLIALSAGAVVLVYLLGIQRLSEPGSGIPSEKKEGLNLSWVNSDFLIGLGVIALGRLALSSVNSFFFALSRRGTLLACHRGDERTRGNS